MKRNLPSFGGRDAASDIDAAFLATATPSYQNDGGNEPTGLHVSTGGTAIDDSPCSMRSLVNPRAFVTRQHGENAVWEIVKSN